MKKKIIIGLLMVSALSFGATTTQRNTTTNQRGMYRTQMMNNLSEKEQTELNKLMQERRNAQYKESLEIRSKELEVQKLTSQDKVNWKTVEKVNKQVYDLKAKQRLEGMKYREEISKKYDLPMNQGRMAMNGNNRNSKNGNTQGNRNNNSRRNGNGMMRNN